MSEQESGQTDEDAIQARERQWVETQIGDVPMREAEG